MTDEVALEGYDAVALVEEGRLRAGSADHAYDWSGQEWRFTSEEHVRRFQSDPERYRPAFGGQCAFGMSLGKDVPGSPKHFRIVDGRLYLQSNPVARFLFGLIPGRARSAEEHWARRDGGR